MTGNDRADSVQRLFFALWPDRTVRRALVGLSGRLDLGAARVVVPDNLHLTLLFIGSVPAARMAEVVACADRVTAPAFDIELDRGGWWRGAGAVWVAPSAPPAALPALAAALREAATAAGFETESRPYRPHVTLARRAARALPAWPRFGIPWPVSRFVLARSLASPAGPVYEVLRQWPTAGPGGRQSAGTGR